MIIDSEFQALIPALSETERSQLELIPAAFYDSILRMTRRRIQANLLADGCRDPLVVWQNKLLDGHNRFDICTRHGIDYQHTVARDQIEPQQKTADKIADEYGVSAATHPNENDLALETYSVIEKNIAA